MIVTDKGLRASERDFAVHMHRLVDDFPQYAKLAKQHGLTGPTGILVLADSVKETFGRTFEAHLSFHQPGAIRRDLMALKRPIVPQVENVAGFMARFGRRRDKFGVAITTNSDVNDGPLDVDVGTVVHEYGHYVEERHQHVLKKTGDRNRSTSFTIAAECIARHCPELSKAQIVRAADELCAWTNAIWLCWLFGIHPSLVVMGMMLDALQMPDTFGPVVLAIVPKLKRVLTTQRSAERAFLVGTFGHKSGEFFETCTEDLRCLFIDLATMRVLASI